MHKDEISFGGVAGFPADSLGASGNPGSAADSRAFHRNRESNPPVREANPDTPAGNPDMSPDCPANRPIDHSASHPAGRPPSTTREYNRVMFLARLVLGFSGLAAFTLGGIALYTGRGYGAIPVGLILLIAALVHYFWVRRAVKRDLRRNSTGDS